MVKSGLSGVGFYEYSVTNDSVYTLKAYTTATITDIEKDKYMTFTVGGEELTDVKLASDAEIYDLTDNGITTLGELADQWDEAKDIDPVTAYVAYDKDDEVVLCVYIVD